MSLIRVVSYNIHKGRSALGRRDSLNELRLGLYGLRPDLVFLQEVQGRNEHKSLLDAQHESLAAALRLDVAYGRNAVRHATDHGNALLSRYPIIDHENLDISDHRLEQRGLLHARVEVGDRAVHCFVVHLGLFAGSRSRQILALTERIKRMVPDGEPILIAGDFNDWNDRLAPMFVQQLGLYEVFSHAPRSHGGDLHCGFVAQPPAQFTPGELVEVDLAASDELKQVVGCAGQNMVGFHAAEVVIVEFHLFSPFAVGFLEDARPEKPDG